MRLSDPTSSLTLSDRLSDLSRPTLADRLGMEDYMEVDQPPEALSMGFNIPRNQLTWSMLDTNAPYQHPVMGDSTSARDSQEEEAMDNIKEDELGYKKTKRGRHSGHKIQGYWRHNEEQEDGNDESKDDADALHNHSTGASISWGGFVRMYSTYLHLA